MFGGVGLYAGDVFFGIVAADLLHLKVDDSNRAQYVSIRMPAFQPYADRPIAMSYYQAPAEAFEDRDELTAWGARTSIRVAARAPLGKSRR